MRGRDTRVRVLLSVVITVVAIGGIFSLMPGAGVEAPTVTAPEEDSAEPEPSAVVAAEANLPATGPSPAGAGELESRFRQGVLMLHSGRYEYAAAAFHRVLELAPRMPEAHVNMGYALLGLERHAAALDFFLTAVELRPEQANGYYGLALASEKICDIATARGAMRTYLHLADGRDRYLRKARAALWEWEEWTDAGDCAGAGPVETTVRSGK